MNRADSSVSAQNGSDDPTLGKSKKLVTLLRVFTASPMKSQSILCQLFDYAAKLLKFTCSCNTQTTDLTRLIDLQRSAGWLDSDLVH